LLNQVDLDPDADSFGRMDGNEYEEEEDPLVFAFTDSEDDTNDEEDRRKF